MKKFALWGLVIAAAATAPLQAQQQQAPFKFSAAYFVGKWSDDGTCKALTQLAPNGAMVSPSGSAGFWKLDGNQLTIGGAGGSVVVTVVPEGANRFRLIFPDGRVGVSTRC